MKKIFTLLCGFLMILVLVNGCGKQKADNKSVADGKIVLEYTEQLKEYGFENPVILNKKPERIVSLVHTPVLALYEMGMTQVAVPENKMFRWPEKLESQAKLLNVSMNDNFDIESVVALEPDLVIVGYQAKDTYGKILEKEKIPVYYVDAGHTVTYSSVKELTFKLLDAFGQNNSGAEQIRQRFDKLETRMAEKRENNKGKKVMVLQSAPPRHFIQSKEGNLGNMADLLGYDNVYQDSTNKLVLLDREQAISYEPDLLLCVGVAISGDEHRKVMEADFSANEVYWQSIKAIREKHIVYLPVKYIATAGINIVDNINELIDVLEAENL